MPIRRLIWGSALLKTLTPSTTRRSEKKNGPRLWRSPVGYLSKLRRRRVFPAFRVYELRGGDVPQGHKIRKSSIRQWRRSGQHRPDRAEVLAKPAKSSGTAASPKQKSRGDQKTLRKCSSARRPARTPSNGAPSPTEKAESHAVEVTDEAAARRANPQPHRKTVPKST